MPVTEKYNSNGHKTTCVTNKPDRPEPDHATTMPVTVKSLW